ncbi:Fe-S oxidoreductase [Tessaracoccus aquimaris]|uniref:Fe-S oxidoreductase n=1 Tax=Tessaracoccus aquimaris TaxID=1332264 RepID=A0A1Q2CLK3_9ACTN|nr:(Fe-S)-binding protein [Tessaracoccus aquimaris]AQP46981.1 Fe-S oxidoreductase [Tessaracoccus aquimaris]
MLSPGTRVALFATCINDTMKPSIPIATVKLLERLGCTVVYPSKQTCCGQIMTNTGYYKDAVPTVRNYVDSFGEFDYIVGPSGSCVGSVREQHAMLARWAKDAPLEEAATAVSGRTYELTEFLVDVLGVTDVGAYFPHRVTYHPTCHSMRITKVGDRPMQLLKAVRGIDLVDLPMADQCCGFGGTFSVKNPDVSIAMASDKARHVRSTDAEYLVAGDQACLMNIGGVLHRQRSGIKTIHLAEILASTEEEVWVA